MKNFRGKVAVVTGAGSGIGRGIALALAEQGCHVVVTDIDGSSAGHVAAEVESRGVQSRAAGLDVTDRDAVEAIADYAWAEFGHVEICVNNAGVFPPLSRAINIKEADARWVLDVNLMGAWYGCSAFGRRFLEQEGETHILNTCSENSLGVAHAGAAFYTASKHALLGLSDVLRYEMPERIGISILCPGMVKTNLQGSVARRHERYGGAKEVTPREGMGLDPEEVGHRAVEGIERGDFYIVTHPPVRDIAQERSNEILDAFDAQAPRVPGVEFVDTRALIPLRRSEP